MMAVQFRIEGVEALLPQRLDELLVAGELPDVMRFLGTSSANG